MCGRYGVSLQPGLTRSPAPNMMASIATAGWLHDAMRRNEAHEPGERDMPVEQRPNHPSALEIAGLCIRPLTIEIGAATNTVMK